MDVKEFKEAILRGRLLSPICNKSIFTIQIQTLPSPNSSPSE
jgi:hypothetical protein